MQGQATRVCEGHRSGAPMRRAHMVRLLRTRLDEKSRQKAPKTRNANAAVLAGTRWTTAIGLMILRCRDMKQHFGKKNVYIYISYIYIYIYLHNHCWFALALRENGWLQNWWSLTMANTKQTKWPKVCVILSFVLSIFLNAPRTKQPE